MRVPRGLMMSLLLAAAPVSAAAQSIFTSQRPDRVAVTVYRDPNRQAGTAMELDWLEGYALISETRRIAIPAGESEIRFEGVAGGIVPQSAIVAGLPDGIVERNRDAYLLSPESLLDRSLGRRVHIRRTSRATGAVTETEAVIRSGAGGAVVLQTAAGFESLRCTGLPEQLVYDGVPTGLSASPTLSVRARAAQAVTATVTLTYLANGFDWQANYIATLSPDGAHVGLFAWLTLGNGDETGFRNADTQAVAGRLNREDDGSAEDDDSGRALQLNCWPAGTTSDTPPQSISTTQEVVEQISADNGPVGAAQEDDANIVVTGTIMRAVQEELGDLKLYRIPEPVTVAARSQKQVAFLDQPAVEIGLIYRQRTDPDANGDPRPANMVLVTRNRRQEGLGLPLPAGTVQLFDESRGRPILLGEGSIADRAVGEDVEIEVGTASGVTSRIEAGEQGDHWQDYVLTLTNDRAVPIRFEMEFSRTNDELRPRGRLSNRNGRPLWATAVPANGTATLRYRVIEHDQDD
jgi:hypothetical protein